MTLRFSAGPSDGQISAFIEDSQFYSFFINQRQIDRLRPIGKARSRNFAPIPRQGERNAGLAPRAGGLKGLQSMIFLAFPKLLRNGPACAAAFAAFLFGFSAEAASKKTEAGKPNLVASFGDWNVFVGKAGKGRICYTLAQPKAREPDSLKRDPGYAFISDRPAEGVRNEVSFIMGFDISGGTVAEAKSDAESDAKSDAKPAAKAKANAKAKPKAIATPLATVGEESFDLLPKGGDLWVKNAARESALITEMKKGAALEIKAASIKGNESTDSYSLAGFSQAMERLQKECPSKS